MTDTTDAVAAIDAALTATPNTTPPVAGEVATPKKSNTVVTTVWNDTKRTLAFTVDKASPTGGSMTLILELDRIHTENRDFAVIFGLKQKISNAAAIPFDPKTKRYATPREKYDAMAVLVEHLNSGAAGWNPKRADRISSDEVMLARALAEVYPLKTADEIRSKVAGYTKAERSALAEHPSIKPIMERMRAESTSGVDADKLLADF